MIHIHQKVSNAEQLSSDGFLPVIRGRLRKGDTARSYGKYIERMFSSSSVLNVATEFAANISAILYPCSEAVVPPFQ